MIRKLLLKLLWLYQHSFSLLGWGSCRYYPSCSEYAKWQFENNSLFYAFSRSFLRILRCNQLFKGGIEYPKRQHFSVEAPRVSLGVNEVKYWLVPQCCSSFSIVKNFSFKR